MSGNLSDTFRIAFQGGHVDCSSLNDAVAIKTADEILLRGAGDQSPARLDLIADLLESYGQTGAARIIAHLATRTRAMQHLIGSVAYERPRTAVANLLIAH